MRRFLDTLSDAAFVLWILPWAAWAAWRICREERRDARLMAVDGGMSPEEARRAFP